MTKCAIVPVSATLAAMLPAFGPTVAVCDGFGVNDMVTVLFTGDSQSCGRNLAIDFPQLVSRFAPVRVINTAVGGSNSGALLRPMTGGTVRIGKGERVLWGEGVRWGMGPFPGMKVRVANHTYTIDFIDEHPKNRAELHLCEPAEADYAGTDYAVEPGWEVRVAAHRPDVVSLMFVNDGDVPPGKAADWRDMVARIRALGAVPVLMSPVPVNDSDSGGNHPGTNERYRTGGEVVRELARTENAWFVDVFSLYFALDPGLRGIVGDGVHPDTDGCTVIVNGLKWVLTELGVMQARPFVTGWRVNGAPAPPAELRRVRAVPFRIAQPDHPDPEHQETRGFSLAAIRRNDDYGLIAAEDGEGVALGQGVLFRCGVPRETPPDAVALDIAGDGIEHVRFWLPEQSRWHAAGSANIGARAAVPVPPAAFDDGAFDVLLTGSDSARLDCIRLQGVPRQAMPSRATLAARPGRAYELVSDHDRAENLVPNAAFTDSEPDTARGWTLQGDARVNRPFTAAVGSVAFDSENDRRVAVLSAPGRTRPFDTVTVRGSTLGNDGPYLVRDALGGGRFRMRKRAEALEAGLAGEVRHDDGCGLVSGGCCVELRHGTAETRFRLPEGAGTVRVSLFCRAFAPGSLGTRDVPPPAASVRMRFLDADGAAAGSDWRLDSLPCSFQWQKTTDRGTIPDGTRSAELRLEGDGSVVLQYTGIFVGVRHDLR